MEDSCAACQTPTAGKKRRLLRGDVKVSSLFQELVPANVKPTKYLCRLCFRNLEKIVLNMDKIKKLTQSTNSMKLEIATKMEEMYLGSCSMPVPQTPSPSLRKELKGACRSLNFNKSPSKKSPGVIVRI